MRLAFMGTPDFAVPALDALVAAGHDVVAVYTQPPRPADRGRVTPSAVQRRAEALGLPVRTPARVRDADAIAAFAALRLDAAVVAAYGLILPPALLAAPRLGCFNIHASLLPRWRGAAPIQRAILAGDAETGVTIMAMEAGLDTGPMLLREATPVAAKTAGALTAELAAMGARLMVAALGQLGSLPALPQPTDGVTHAAKIAKAEARIDWREDASAVLRRMRAMTPAPGAWFDCGGERVKLLAADAADAAAAPGTLVGDVVACGGGNGTAFGGGGVRPLQVRPAGGRAMEWAAFARGRAMPDRLA